MSRTGIFLYSYINILKYFTFIVNVYLQVELYTHHKSISIIAEKLEQNLIRLCSVHLVDSHHCSDAGNFYIIIFILFIYIYNLFIYIYILLIYLFIYY